MPEHLIRLRGPWELIDPASPDSPASRIALPAESLPDSPRPLRLRRRFGRPARIDGRLHCRLRAQHVPGLTRMSLNGVELLPRAEPAPQDPEPVEVDADVEVEVEVGPLLQIRNVLELTVDPPREANRPAGVPWGSIALSFDDDIP